MKKRNQVRAQARACGFTRIEAVALLGAVGVVGAAVIPATAQGGLFDVFGRARENARRATCQSNLKQIGLGVIQYTQDYDEKMPLATLKGKDYGWVQVIQPYVKSTQILQCPSERHLGNGSFKKPGYTDYWLNRAASGKSLAAIAGPSQSIAMGDGDGGSALSDARYSIAALPPGWVKTAGSPARRHPLYSAGGANYAFLDGHVKVVAPGDISTATLAKAGAKPTFSIK